MPYSTPDWLEPIVCLEDFDGDSVKYLDHLFSIFRRDFVDSSPVYEGKRVFHDKTNDGGRPATFVHITTEDNKQTGSREVCLRRCERIAWIKAIIEHVNDPLVLVWRKEQKTSKRIAVRTYLFLEQESFIVILQELKHGHFMVTAFYVDHPHQKRKYLKAHSDFQRKTNI